MDRYSDMAILIAVVDARGFSPAARKLKMTHSAISKRVQRLEDRLGTQLLSRTTRYDDADASGRKVCADWLGQSWRIYRRWKPPSCMSPMRRGGR